MNIQSVNQPAYNFWLRVAAWSSMVASIIHAYYIFEHFEVWIVYGAFFLAATVCQFLLASLLYAIRPVHRVVLWAGILGNAAIIALWMVTRTIGIPLGPLAGEVEAMGVLDLLSKIAELVVIVCLVVVLRAKVDATAYDGLPSP
ncbi:MAG: hypothetical protein AB1846_09245 [Chloroflexota bacterium]